MYEAGATMMPPHPAAETKDVFKYLNFHGRQNV